MNSAKFKVQSAGYRGQHAGRGGNALVLSVLLLLSLTSIGLIAMKRTGSDLAVSGNVVRANQTWQAGEAGARQTLAHMRKYLWHELVNMQITGRQAATMSQQAIEEIKSFTTAGAAVNPDHLPVLDPTNAADDTIGRSLQAIAYRVNLLPLASLERHDMAGFETENICFEVFEMNSQSGVPNSLNEPIDETMSGKKSVVTGSRMRAVIGPFKCQLR